MGRKALLKVERNGTVHVMPLVHTDEGWALNNSETWHCLGTVSTEKRLEQTKHGIHLTRKRGMWITESGVQGLSRNYDDAITDLLAYFGLEASVVDETIPPLF